MTYERDRDHALKGVGAIAARDAGSASRQALRVRQAQMTQARDRTMARIGYDARGMRRGAMGAVDQTTGPSVWAGRASDAPATTTTKLYQGAGSFPYPTKTPTTVSAGIAFPYPTTGESPPLIATTQSPPIIATSPPFVPVYVQSPPFAVSQLPPDPALPVVLQPTTGLTDAQKKWAVIGAVGLAAYFLFRKGGAAAT